MGIHVDTKCVIVKENEKKYEDSETGKNFIKYKCNV